MPTIQRAFWLTAAARVPGKYSRVTTIGLPAAAFSLTKAAVPPIGRSLSPSS